MPLSCCVKFVSRTMETRQESSFTMFSRRPVRLGDDKTWPVAAFLSDR